MVIYNSNNNLRGIHKGNYTLDLEIIFSSRFIILSCNCKLWTWMMFCWSRILRTSLQVSSMALLNFFCSSNMASINFSFFFWKLQFCIFLFLTGLSSALKCEYLLEIKLIYKKERTQNSIAYSWPSYNLVIFLNPCVLQ